MSKSKRLPATIAQVGEVSNKTANFLQASPQDIRDGQVEKVSAAKWMKHTKQEMIICGYQYVIMRD
jgi:hypothetical protein